ncbi:MAG: hemin receptor, partial [Dehalococcoidia bacterium]
KLFEIDPDDRGLFKEDLSLQKKQLMATISFAVATLKHPELLVPAAQALGKRHGEYGVTPAH